MSVKSNSYRRSIFEFYHTIHFHYRFTLVWQFDKHFLLVSNLFTEPVQSSMVGVFKFLSSLSNAIFPSHKSLCTDLLKCMTIEKNSEYVMMSIILPISSRHVGSLRIWLYLSGRRLTSDFDGRFCRLEPSRPDIGLYW